MPGWSGQLYGKTPFVPNVRCSSWPGTSSVSVPHVRASPTTRWLTVAVFRNRTAVPTGTWTTVGANEQVSMRTTVESPSVWTVPSVPWHPPPAETGTAPSEASRRIATRSGGTIRRMGSASGTGSVRLGYTARGRSVPGSRPRSGRHRAAW